MTRSQDSPTPRREFRARRWLNVVLRALHLVAVMALGALLLGAAPTPGWSPGRIAGAVVVTGLAMLALDLYADRQHLRTAAGLTALGKLVLVAVLAFTHGPLLFWAIVAGSAVVSHAPATFRHRVLVPPTARPPLG